LNGAWVVFSDAVVPLLAGTVTGLTNNVSYEFRVRALNAVGWGAYSSTTVVTPAALPPERVATLAATAGNAQATLTWSVPQPGSAPILSYRVQYSTNGGTSWTSAPNTAAPATGAIVSGLTNGLPHVFRVAAVNKNGPGPWSPLSSPVTPVGPAFAPTWVAVTASNQQVALSWTTPNSNGSPITGYMLERSSNEGVVVENLGLITSRTVTALTNGVAYSFRVAAVTAFGRGTYSVVGGPVTPATVPTVPQNLVVTAGDATAMATWATPASNGGTAILGYVLEMSSIAGTVTQLLGLVTSFTATGLTNGVEYTFRVAARNAQGVGPFTTSSAATVTPVGPSFPPGWVSASASDRQVDLAWTTPLANGRPITGYVLERTSVEGRVVENVGVTNSRTVVGLTNGVAYTFRVAAVTSFGQGQFSVTAGPLMPLTVPTSPMNLVVVGGDTTATATWSAPVDNGGAPVLGYVLEITSAAGTVTQTIGPVNSFTATGLTNGVAHTFRLAAVNSVGIGPYATAATAVTPLPLANPPTRLSGQAGNGNVSLVWTAPTLTGGLPIVDYRVQYSTNYTGNPATATWLDVADIISAAVRTTVAVPNGQTYAFRVAAVTRAGVGRFSTPSLALTPFSPTALPAAPTGLRATSPVSRQAHLTWAPTPTNEGGPVVAYVLQYRLSTSATWQSIRTTTPARVLTGLVSGRDYVFRVRAQNLAGLGAFGQEVTLRVS